jgi:hypothetical protein
MEKARNRTEKLLAGHVRKESWKVSSGVSQEGKETGLGKLEIVGNFLLVFGTLSGSMNACCDGGIRDC